MRQKIFGKKVVVCLLAGAMLFSVEPGIKTKAAEQTYTVTYRAGNVGCFAISGTGETDKKAMAEEVAKVLYHDEENITEVTVTGHGAIKLAVKKGTKVPDAPGDGFVQAEAGYFVKSVSQWGPKPGETVTQNVDFVVDYGRLADSAEGTPACADSANSAEASAMEVVGNAVQTAEQSAVAEVAETIVKPAAGAVLAPGQMEQTAETELEQTAETEPQQTTETELKQITETDLISEKNSAQQSPLIGRKELVKNGEETHNNQYAAVAVLLLMAVGSIWLRYKVNAKGQ